MASGRCQKQPKLLSAYHNGKPPKAHTHGGSKPDQLSMAYQADQGNSTLGRRGPIGPLDSFNTTSPRRRARESTLSTAVRVVPIAIAIASDLLPACRIETIATSRSDGCFGVMRWRIFGSATGTGLITGFRPILHSGTATPFARALEHIAATVVILTPHRSAMLA
jgi:hypothetical protein